MKLFEGLIVMGIILNVVALVLGMMLTTDNTKHTRQLYDRSVSASLMAELAGDDGYLSDEEKARFVRALDPNAFAQQGQILSICPYGDDQFAVDVHDPDRRLGVFELGKIRAAIIVVREPQQP
ncbi:MAG: hypothetical protein HC888_13260 [Candidatus Competibacteraceae bacterium]|nr:hypothetical protein [Candidatus Competibacteraceae bacterium]